MITLLLLLLMTSCIWTETEYEPIPPVEYRKKPHKDFPADSTQNEDTTRIPIEFNPSVEDWEEIEENL
jgi:hypothetical protein